MNWRSPRWQIKKSSWQNWKSTSIFLELKFSKFPEKSSFLTVYIFTSGTSLPKNVLTTWTNSGMQWRLLITALLCASRAKIWSAPTHPSTMSSILTPSITTLCPGLLCISWWERIISWTSCGKPPCSRIGVWLRGQRARFRMRPITALMSGQRDGG